MTAVSIEQAIKANHAEVRKRLWGKPEKEVSARPALEFDTAEARKLREARLAEQRILAYRREQRRLEEQRELDREAKKLELRIKAEQRAKEKIERAEQRRRELMGPLWEDIAPKLRPGSIKEVCDQVLSFFPNYTIDEVRKKNKTKARSKILGLMTVAVRHLDRSVTMEEIACYLQRDYSTISWHISRSHLKDELVRRPSFNKSKLMGKHDQIKKLYDLGLLQKEIAAQFGVGQSAIGRLVARYGWTRSRT